MVSCHQAISGDILHHNRCKIRYEFRTAVHTLGFRKLTNIERHTAHTIVSWPNPKQWVIVHTSDLMMIIRQSIYILSIITREMGKLKTHNPTYCIMVLHMGFSLSMRIVLPLMKLGSLLLPWFDLESRHGWVSTYISKCGMKLIFHIQKSVVQPLKFGNGYLIWSRISLVMWLLINTGIYVNPC